MIYIIPYDKWTTTTELTPMEIKERLERVTANSVWDKDRDDDIFIGCVSESNFKLYPLVKHSMMRGRFVMQGTCIEEDGKTVICMVTTFTDNRVLEILFLVFFLAIIIRTWPLSCILLVFLFIAINLMYGITVKDYKRKIEELLNQ